MLSCVRYEAIGWGAPGGRYDIAQAFADAFTRNIRKPWCARVVGFFPSGKPRYEFLRGIIDYRNSNSRMTRGVEMVFYPESGGIYHGHYFTSWKSSRDVWFRVSDDGDVIEMPEAAALINAREALNG